MCIRDRPDNDDNALAAMAGAPQKQGLSKEDRDRRDMFAAAALTGLLSNPDAYKAFSNNHKRNADIMGKVLSENAFYWADDMLKASQK